MGSGDSNYETNAYNTAFPGGSLKEAWDAVRATIEAQPSEVYEKQYRLFRRLYEQTKDIAHELGQEA